MRVEQDRWCRSLTMSKKIDAWKIVVRGTINFERTLTNNISNNWKIWEGKRVRLKKLIEKGNRFTNLWKKNVIIIVNITGNVFINNDN